MNSSRFPWVDHLKALGILLVVAGHCGLSVEEHRWIYAFHMPLFFLISGFLISPGAFADPARAFFMRRVWKLVKYYGMFGLLGTVVYCYVFRHEQPLQTALAGRLASLAYGSASTHTPSDLYPMVLWFFPGLIGGMLITFAVWQIPSIWTRVAAMSAVVIGGFLMEDIALPWELESGCVAAGFIALGHCARVRGWDGLLQRLPIRQALPVAMAALLLGSYLAAMNIECLDIELARIGNPLLAIPACGLILLALAIIAMNLPAWSISETIAAATILIFPMHTLVFPYVDRMAMKLGVLTPNHAGGQSPYAWEKACFVVAGISMAHFCYVRAKARGPFRRGPRGA